MKKNVFQRLWEWILSLFPKQEIEIPKPKEEEPIPEEPEGVPPATEPEEDTVWTEHLWIGSPKFKFRIRRKLRRHLLVCRIGFTVIYIN